MCHFVLLHYLQKEILFTRNMHRKDIERTCLDKLTKLISSDTEINCSKSFSDDSNSSDVEE